MPPGVSWAEVRDHIKIAHHHLLVLDDGDYTGAYWTGTDMALVTDLGPDQEEAIEEFRAYLQEHDGYFERQAAAPGVVPGVLPGCSWPA